MTEYSLYLLFHCIFVRLANVNELFIAFEKEMEKEEKVASWGFWKIELYVKLQAHIR